ncbi:MAG: type VI secretion system tip protein TssI/VgrG [Polyangiaceae bacterium]
MSEHAQSSGSDPTRALSARIESEAFAVEGLHLTGLRGREAISSLFRFELDLLTAPLEVGGPTGVPKGCVPGAPLRLVLSTESDGPVRWVHGVIDEVRDSLEVVHGRLAFSITLVPVFAALELVRTQEVHVALSVPEVLSEKLALHRLSFVTRWSTEYAKRALIVQYAESDLAFVSRLTEHLGIAYFFASDDAGCRAIFTDSAEGFDSVGQIAFTDRSGSAAGEGRILSLRSVSRRVTSAVLVQDQNYRTPLVELTGAADVEGGAGGGVVEYATHHRTPEEGAHLARMRAEAVRNQQHFYEGTSGCARLTAGHRVNVIGHPTLPDPTELLVVEVEHEGSWPLMDVAANSAVYTNRFRAVPAAHGYRPPERTPRPRIHGIVTGIVRAPEGVADGSLPFLDALGRYLVELHFDTFRVPNKALPSHPIRMAQPTQGPNHGMHFPLRPGAEVIVAFLDGDPDRPVIVGAVPNAIAPSPVNHQNPNHSVIRTADGGVLIELVDLPFDGQFEDAPGVMPHYARNAPSTGGDGGLKMPAQLPTDRGLRRS